MRIIWFLLAILSAVFCKACAPPSEVSALNDLYNATNGKYWYQQHNWGIGDPCLRLWIGVKCKDCRVTELGLFSNNLTGTIPSSMSQLSHLQQLDLSNNNLAGTIPAGCITEEITDIFLNSNDLIGTIPGDISSLQYLNSLYLNDNNLSGTIPRLTFTSPSGSVDLSNNNLNGTIPWSENPGLAYFNISNNQFSCPLPLWCNIPPIGNGLCVPCVTNRNAPLFCCYYSGNGCQSISYSTCQQGVCSSLPELDLCKQSVTISCSKCKSTNINVETKIV